ncbi:AzlC family protein [Neisseria meningitidis]|nr:AzlC family protein [Neisseria meningitidis]MBG8616888.1 AzlC family protein [Neisseria meningitidis]MBJ7777654.1 AzlC family protein [Neisseria meningitidis]MBJ7828136.1 AzlC family protein [Neisseria meningitidis]
MLYWKLPFSTIPSDKPCRIRFYSGLTKTSTALPRLSSKRTIL